MGKYVFLLYTGVFLETATMSAQIKPQITAGVDTSKTEIKKVLVLYTSYLNSHPDSAYNNPYWSEKEQPTISGDGKFPSDRFFWANYWLGKSLPKFKYTVLAIDKIYNTGIYTIRTLINDTTSNAHWNNELFDPPFITVYYAEKMAKGWKLENAINEETKSWKHYDTKYIHYIYPPEFNFQNDLANKADSFCTALMDTFGIPYHKPFDYYLTVSIEQMGRLFNMEYWGAPVYGYSLFYANQIVSARATEYHIHEFTHMLLPRSKNAFIEEGKATFFGGLGDESFQKGLMEFSREIKNNDTITFSEIYNRQYFHMTDSRPFYVSGAVVCKFVYDKKGIEGLKELISCPGNSEEDFDETVSKILGIDKRTFERKVIEYIKTYPTNISGKG